MTGTAARFDVDEAGVVAFAAELVRHRTVADGEAEAAAARLVAGRMRAWGWEPSETEVRPGRPNVVVTVDGGGGPGPLLGFEGHLDVVAEGDPADWTEPPYEARVVGGRMYGRGAADMKGGVAAMLYGVRALQQRGPFPGAVRLLALADEEGMMTGARHAVSSGALDGVDGVIVCEPEGDEVCPASKGALRLRVGLAGVMAHGAMPERGRNPLAVLAGVTTMLAAVQAELRDAHGRHPELGWASVTPTVAQGGVPAQMNTIPARAALWVDVRTIPGVDHGELVDRIASEATTIGEAAGVGVELEVIDDRPAVETPADHPVVTCVLEAHRRVTGEPARLGGVPGTTDGTIITAEGHVPTVVYGPGGKWVAHQADEWVAVGDIPRYARTYAEAASIFLHSGAA